MKSIKELKTCMPGEAMYGYLECKEDVVKLIDELYDELENDDELWCEHIKLIQKRIKQKIEGK